MSIHVKLANPDMSIYRPSFQRELVESRDGRAQLQPAALSVRCSRRAATHGEKTLEFGMTGRQGLWRIDERLLVGGDSDRFLARAAKSRMSFMNKLPLLLSSLSRCLEAA